MFSRPRQLETEAEMYDVAVRALMRRAHSIHEMKQKLERRSDNKLLVQVVMARLKENGLMDDARYAKQFARQRIERKLRSYRGPDTGKKIDEKKMASLYGSLLRAGFSADVVRRELKALTREELPEVEME